MIARRLLIFALVLLVVTAISTALAPPPGQRLADRDPSPAPSGASETALVERTVDATDVAPADVELQEGDRLRLTVESDEAGYVELRDLGQLKAIAPGTPAVFDVLPPAGEYPVVLDGVRTAATVRVSSDE